MALTLDRLRQLFGPRFEELTGAHVSADIPISERVINVLLADWLRAAGGPVASAEVQVRAAGELLVRVRLRKPAFAPAVIVGLRIEEQPEVPRPAILVMRWSLPGLPVLGGLLGPILPFLRMGPPWITLKGERILVDIARTFEERGAADLLDRVASLQVTTRSGAIVVSFVLHVHG